MRILRNSIHQSGFALIALAAYAGLSACIIGSNEALPPKPDAKIVDAKPPADAPPDAFICEPPINNVGNGHHLPGENCLACHDGNSANGAPKFTVAGTLYNGPSGAAPVPNTAVVVIDSTGRRIVMPTQQNGNFYTSAELTFPVTTLASQCPKTKTMQGGATGNCNARGCHAAGDPSGRIYLQVGL